QVPVREERVRVERHAVDRPVAASEREAFADQVIEVPLRGETVEAQKEVRVAEEIEIGKEAVERSETVSGTVRREEVEVRESIDSTDLLPDDDTSRRP
ncbi:MAG: YsnF/AvaK domain-containing protein, partial [Chloroflexota bacterium]|nr:YsnF/AvaK domain-containing protein [Chloroflexota bacterium]